MVRLGTITKAAQSVEIDRSTHYYWLENDEEYAIAFRRAEQMAADLLEEEAWRRAVEGDERPIYSKGKKIGSVRNYSDGLLTFLLKGAKPEKYKDRVQNEVVDMGGASMSWEGAENGDGTKENSDTV